MPPTQQSASTGPEASETAGNQLVPNQLAILVPSFDPSRDDIRVYSAKVELLTQAWPPNRFKELSTRLILGCTGSAFHKLQLRQAELTDGTEKSIAKIIEVLGGDWGQIPLEKKYESAERAIYHCVQRPDESNDSYLARSDILWTELLGKQMELEELQSYIVLRGSGLSAEDKKRVVLESNAAADPQLTMKKVSQSIRMLGAGFFHDVTGQKRAKTKIYDPDSAMIAEEEEAQYTEMTDSVYQAIDDGSTEDDHVDSLLSEGDPDAIYITDFENAAGELLQSDGELAACYNTYLEARQRLAERAKHRGFWPSSFRGKGKGGKGSVKGKFNRSFGKGGKRSLQQRILNSTCRRCGQTGHWKAECPLNRPGSSSTSSAPSNSAVSFPSEPSQTSQANVYEVEAIHPDALPLEFLNLEEIHMSTIDEPHMHKELVFAVSDLVVMDSDNRSQEILNPNQMSCDHKREQCFLKVFPSVIVRNEPASKSALPISRDALSLVTDAPLVYAATACSRGTCGVLDSGATKTVIGSQHVADLIAGFEPHIQRKLQRTKCSITFRFGNQGTLDATHALVVPLGSLLLQIAIVPGATPFLVSNSLLRALRCTLDAAKHEIRSPMLKGAVPLELTPKGLFLIDINKVAESAIIRPNQIIETFNVSETAIDNQAWSSQHRHDVAHPSRAQAATRDCDSRVIPCEDHGQSQQPLEEDPNASAGGTSRASTYDSGGTIKYDVPIRIDTSRQDFPRALGEQSSVDHLDDGSLLPISKDWASPPDGVHRTEDSRSRTTGHCCAIDGSTQEVRDDGIPQDEADSKAIDDAFDAEGQIPGSTTAECRDRGFVVRGRDAHGVHRHPGGCDRVAGAHVESRVDASTSSDTSDSEVIREMCHICSELAGDGDLLEEWILNQSSKEKSSISAVSNLNHERSRLHYLISRYEQELKVISESNVVKRPKCDVFEVFCGDQSQITNQCLKLQGSAFRFGMSQGDLQSPEGRRNLFSNLIEKRPRHIWFSPTCGPWSSWSQFNGQRSVEAWEDLLSQRHRQLEQIALGIVLFRFQRQMNHHFHWEQPARSLMFKMPYLSEVFQHSQCAEFDMCVVGDLRDPQSNKPMKKGMIVATTSQILYQCLHGRHCPGNHDHQQIEGSTIFEGKPIRRSQFSERYTRRFAKQVADYMCSSQGRHENPFVPQNAAETLVTGSSEAGPLWKKPRMSADRRANMKQPSVSTPPDSPCLKRRKLENKQTPPTQKEVWSQIFRVVQECTPRVGKKIIKDASILQLISDIWPDKQLQFLVVCRGTDRALGPNCQLTEGEAPYRRCAFVHRTTGEINVEDHWERWDQLSQRQINRPNHPCRLNITVFARNPDQTNKLSGDFNDPLIPSSQDSSVSQSPRPVATGQFDEEEPKDPIDLDASHMKHGPRFLSLTSEEKQTLVKIHRNMGHPSAERLMHLLRQQGFRSECVDAVPDMKCSTCEMTSKPKISRPSIIKDPMDFNDKIAIDCLKWTNKAGLGFHVLHIIDFGTSFHVACVAPNRTSQNAIQNITTSWLQWAGAPNEMIVDSGTEFNSDEFMQFLQRFNIKSTTIVPEGHWQNGRSERHGAILESMLTKFDLESPIMSYTDLHQALWFIMQAKNACSLRRGYAPEVLVFGKHTRLPGSISSDQNLPAHCLADSETAQGLAFRKQLDMREIARRAFWHADNQASLRRAILRRSRPARKSFVTGEWVMVWKSLPKPGMWIGPMRVVTHENESTIWLTMSGKLYRAAPENVRDVSAVEAQQVPKQEIPFPIIQKGITQFRELLPQETFPGTDLTDSPADNTGNANPEQSNEDNESPNQVPSEPPIQSLPSEQPDLEPEASSQTSLPDATATGLDVPIPSSGSEDENLQCVGLHCQDCEVPCLVSIDDHPNHNGLKWSMEILVTSHDIAQWKEEDDPSDMIFLATAAKRQRAEVRMSELTSDERRQFIDAKDSEVQNWLKTGTVMKILRSQIPPEEVLRCRWVLTWKPVEPSADDPEPSKKAKARLVVLGYMDPSLEKIPRDSPTLGRHSKLLILQMIASHGWTLQSFDVKAAFLQGSVAGRTIGLEPVPELARALKMNHTELCKLNKSAYGLIDAPYLWYKTLLAELLRLGFIQAPFDPCTFILKRPNSHQVAGVLGVHVDDGLCGGDEYFTHQLKRLAEKYPFGAQKSSSFTFTGIELNQKGDGGIVMSQSKYVREIGPIKIDANRRTTPDEKITDEERHSLRGLIGSLQYAAVNTRPDISSQLSFLQSAINSGTVETLIQANRTLHDAKKHHDVSITIHPISPGDVRFLAFSDASFASKRVPDSHSGMIILTTHKDIVHNVTCPVSPVSWGCKKIQKVVTSTLSAETMALTSTLDQLSWLRLFWAWLLDTRTVWQEPTQTLSKLPPAVASPTWKSQTLPEATTAVDCKSLFDLVTKTAPPQCSEFRTQLHARAIKDLLSENTTLRWVHSGAQLADALTKIMEASFLRNTLKYGRYRLNDELEILKQRSNSRNRLKWLRNTCGDSCCLALSEP